MSDIVQRLRDEAGCDDHRGAGLILGIAAREIESLREEIELANQKREFAEFEWNRATDGMKERDAQLASARKALEDCDGCIVAAEAEGLNETIESLRNSEHFDITDVFRLIDLVERRLVWVRNYALPALKDLP